MPIYYIPKTEFKVIHYEDIKPFVDNAEPEDFKVLIALTWLTGARIQEIVNLKKRDIIIDEKGITVIIKALKQKRQATGKPSFGFRDPFISDLIIPYLKKIENEDEKLFKKTKRRYQQLLKKLNEKLYPEDKSKWITFHYLRHSRITFLARELGAYPEEIKSWTGHRSVAFEEYISFSKVERFRNKIY